MKNFRYIEKTITLKLDEHTCVGCGACFDVCPHRVIDISNKKAKIVDYDSCMECGACAMNCPVGAIEVTPGVGCAVAIISSLINKVVGRNVMKDCC